MRRFVGIVFLGMALLFAQTAVNAQVKAMKDSTKAMTKKMKEAKKEAKEKVKTEAKMATEAKTKVSKEAKEKMSKGGEAVKETASTMKASTDEAVGKTEDGKTVFAGSRGGHYYYNSKGNKTYVSKDTK